MTYRLVGFMSIVLLLSLAAFALLMSHYQAEVRGELARTVSEVGRETLRTLELQPLHNRLVAAGAHRVSSDDSEVVDLIDPGEGQVVFVTAFRGPTTEKAGDGYMMIKRKGQAAQRIPLDECSGIRETVAFETEMTTKTDVEVRELEEVKDKADAQIGGLQQVTTVIQLDGIRAEEEAEGLFLRIPTLRADAEEANRFEFAWGAGSSGDSTVAPEPPTFTEEYRFEVPTEDYQNLFSTLRRRSGFIFLGVFLVGTALSAGLASRFTRPVRRLDAAIHRLSEGDLAVQVPVRGRDEMARLGRAFNEMATKLRSNRERARELTRREKLSALGRLAAGVAHDVRNPLHSIGLTLQYLRDTCRPESEERGRNFDRSVSIIRGEIHRLDKLVENFLHFARSDRQERAPVSLPDLARETVRLVEKEAERRGVEIEVVADETTPIVSADAESIRASILNLVLNSFEAMPDGGALRIRVEPNAGEVVLEVSDTGQGIPEAEQERVFDFAFTTREGGNGLGLAMVHQVVVEEHGGRVSLDSRPGQGTRVSLVFPLESGQSAPEATS